MSAEQTPDIETVTSIVLDSLHYADHHGGMSMLSLSRHVAQALAPVLAAAVREALREAANEAEALQTFAHGNNPRSHAFSIGYGTSRRLIVRQLRDRADRVAETQHEAATSNDGES